MQSLDYRVIAQALAWLQNSSPVWLCTVLHTYGSSPRSPGSLLAATAQGEFIGSLSGGCIEEDFLSRIALGEFCQPSQVVRYGKGGRETAVELPCGGTLDVLIEYLPQAASTLDYLSQLLRALKGEVRLLKSLLLPQAAMLETCPARHMTSAIRYQQQEIMLPIGSVPTLLIAGYSAVAHDCIKLAEMLGFEVVICEHREEQQRQLQQDFSDLSPYQVISQHPALYLEKHGASSSTAIVSLTHDPRIDDLALSEAVTTEAFYIGAMGSHANSLQRRERLQRISELTTRDLERIHAPIGLPIGSKTPAEIALSILADIVRCKNSNNKINT